MKRKVIIFYDYFSPAFKAGGPIQSIVNMVQALYEEFDFYVITGCRDFGEKQYLPGITVNEWMSWKNMCKVFYWDPSITGLAEFRRIILKVKADVFYINGVYSVFFNLFPKIFAGKNANVVIAPRGMLHEGALSQKPIKKKIYLNLIRFSGLYRNVKLHATDKNEEAFIRNILGKKSKVQVAGNFPRQFDYRDVREKKTGTLALFTIALISPMKNNLKILQALKKVTGNIEYSIYGPVKDESYWQQCCEEIRLIPGNIKIHIHGPLVPDEVEEVIAKNDVMVLPSKSENFGHSIIESLQVGRPVITTITTPYKDLEEFQAGFSIDPTQLDEELHLRIQKFIDMDSIEMKNVSRQARNYATSRIDIQGLREEYSLVLG